MTYNPQVFNGFSWRNAGPITFKCRHKTTGVLGTAPTKGTTSVDQFRYRRIGDTMFFKIDYKQTGVGLTGGGTSYLYLIELPDSLQIDTSKVASFPGGAISDGTLGPIAVYAVGYGAMQTQSNSDLNTVTTPFVYSTTELGIFVGQTALWDADSGFDFPDSNPSLGIMGMVPIQGWA